MKCLTLQLICCFLVACGFSGEASIPQASPEGRTPDVAPAQAEVGRREIRPGHSVGSLKIGDDKETALRVLGSDRHFEYQLNSPDLACPTVSLEWGDQNPDFGAIRNGIRAVLKDGLIVQIKVDSTIYSTPRGIASGSPPSVISPEYPDLKRFVLKNSSPDNDSAHDYHYWVSEKSGIAFELEEIQGESERRIRYIFIFAPNTRFLPNGCVTEPQAWEELR